MVMGQYLVVKYVVLRADGDGTVFGDEVRGGESRW